MRLSGLIHEGLPIASSRSVGGTTTIIYYHFSLACLLDEQQPRRAARGRRRAPSFAAIEEAWPASCLDVLLAMVLAMSGQDVAGGGGAGRRGAEEGWAFGDYETSALLSRSQRVSHARSCCQDCRIDAEACMPDLL